MSKYSPDWDPPDSLLDNPGSLEGDLGMPGNELDTYRNRLLLLFVVGVVAYLCLVCSCAGLAGGAYYLFSKGKTSLSPGTGTSLPPGTSPTAAPTSSGANSAYDTAKLYAGEWDGPWTNTTYNSHGTAKVTITVNPDGTASFDLGLTGNVLGLGQAPSITVMGSYDDSGFTFQDRGNLLFGDLSIKITFTGSVQMKSSALSVKSIKQVSAQGAMSNYDLNVTYQVVFSSGKTADGYAQLTHAP